MRFGWPEMLLILAIVMIVFGVGKLPQVGGQLGKAFREMRRAGREDDAETRVESLTQPDKGESK